jgi:hypothetical protein
MLRKTIILLATAAVLGSGLTGAMARGGGGGGHMGGGFGGGGHIGGFGGGHMGGGLGGAGGHMGVGHIGGFAGHMGGGHIGGVAGSLGRGIGEDRITHGSMGSRIAGVGETYHERDHGFARGGHWHHHGSLYDAYVYPCDDNDYTFENHKCLGAPVSSSCCPAP